MADSAYEFTVTHCIEGSTWETLQRKTYPDAGYENYSTHKATNPDQSVTLTLYWRRPKLPAAGKVQDG